MGYIYKITNTVNGKAYIGQTTMKLEHRISCHFSSNGCPALHNAIQKYGRDAFTVETLHETLDIFLDDLEVAEIKRHNSLVPNGYNLHGGGNTNRFVSDQTRKKLSESLKGRTHSPETRKKISEGNKGKIRSPENRQKLSEAHKGKTLSLEHRKKISEGNKGKTLSPETRKKLSDRKWSPETRKKLSEAAKGRRHTPETRKKLSDRRRTPEARRKMSEINAHPERSKAFQILNALPEDTSLDERRKHLRDKFPERSRFIIHDWVKQWSKTSSTCAPSDRHIAFQILNALPEDMPLKEKYKHLRDKFPERPRGTIHGWVRKWSKTSP